MEKAIEIVTKAGGVMQENIARVPLGRNLQTVDAVRDQLEAAGYKVLAGNISFGNETQVLKIEKKA